MRILGIDPGTRVTGYGVVDEEGHKLSLIEAGEIKTPVRMSLPKRLRQIYEGLTQLIQEIQPSAVAIENTFLSNNFSTALKLGQACGVALLAAEMSNLEVYEYTPAEVKLAVVGYGVAEKEQVRRMVDHLLDRYASPQDTLSHHATDALAVAICHLHSRVLREMAATRSAK